VANVKTIRNNAKNPAPAGRLQYPHTHPSPPLARLPTTDADQRPRENAAIEDKRDWLADVDGIRKILMAGWKPIGCGVPDDEYDDYIPGIHHLLRQGADVQSLTRHLERIETKSMCLRGNVARNESVAVSLLALMHQP
jgi:hypothetical protein